MAVLEICVDCVQSAIAAKEGGADRVELCSALTEGGLTPSLGLIRAVRSAVGIGLHILIRPRSGDFLYSDTDYGVMRDDICTAARSGADGVVLGVLTLEGDVDVDRTQELVALAYPMEVTFHRAFDLVRDQLAALEDVVETGARRILTSGGRPSVIEGREQLRALVGAAKGRLRTAAGGGLRIQNAHQVAACTGATDFHASLRTPLYSQMKYATSEVHLGNPERDNYARSIVRADDVRALRAALQRV